MEYRTSLYFVLDTHETLVVNMYPASNLLLPYQQMPNCFIYGDSNGLWAILEKQWPIYKKHGYTWYCECIVDKQKSLQLFDIKTSDINLYEIKESLLSLLHFFPGFTDFKVRVRQEAKLDTGEIKEIPIIMNMREFIKALTKQNQFMYNDISREYEQTQNKDTNTYRQLYPVGDNKVSQTPTLKNIKIVI